jgi:hypothetical protein
LATAFKGALGASTIFGAGGAASGGAATMSLTGLAGGLILPVALAGAAGVMLGRFLDNNLGLSDKISNWMSGNKTPEEHRQDNIKERLEGSQKNAEAQIGFFKDQFQRGRSTYKGQAVTRDLVFNRARDILKGGGWTPGLADEKAGEMTSRMWDRPDSIAGLRKRPTGKLMTERTDDIKTALEQTVRDINRETAAWQKQYGAKKPGDLDLTGESYFQKQLAAKVAPLLEQQGILLAQLRTNAQKMNQPIYAHLYLDGKVVARQMLGVSQSEVDRAGGRPESVGSAATAVAGAAARNKK